MTGWHPAGRAAVRIAGLAAFLIGVPALLLGVAAQASAHDGGDRADLLGTLGALGTTSHDVVMTTSDSTIKGSVDPEARAASIAATSGDLEVDEVVHNGHVWLRMDLGRDANSQLGIIGGQWMSMDPAKMSATNHLPIQPDASDPIDMRGIFAGIVDVTHAHPTTFTGTLDLTKVAGRNAPDPDEVARAGEAATRTPFTVTTDDQGRIATLSVDTSAFDPALGVTVAYSGYGNATPITDPTGDVPAPDSVYSVFN